jgi:hypothetical protein
MVKIVSAVLIFSGVYFRTAQQTTLKLNQEQGSKTNKRTTTSFLIFEHFRKKYDTINDWFW